MRTTAHDRLRARKLALLMLENAALEHDEPIPDVFTDTPIEVASHPVTAMPGYNKLKKMIGAAQGKALFRLRQWLDREIAVYELRVAGLKRKKIEEAAAEGDKDAAAALAPQEDECGPT